MFQEIKQAHVVTREHLSQGRPVYARNRYIGTDPENHKHEQCEDHFSSDFLDLERLRNRLEHLY